MPQAFLGCKMIAYCTKHNMKCSCLSGKLESSMQYRFKRCRFYVQG